METLQRPAKGAEASVEAARSAAIRKDLVFLVGPNAELVADSPVSQVREVVRRLTAVR